MSNETRICNDKMQKNDNSCVNVQKHTRIPSMNALAMFVSQIFVVVLLAIAAILPIATAKITLILCLIIMLTFIALWPLHGNVIDRAIAIMRRNCFYMVCNRSIKGMATKKRHY